MLSVASSLLPMIALEVENVFVLVTVPMPLVVPMLMAVLVLMAALARRQLWVPSFRRNFFFVCECDMIAVPVCNVLK